MDQLHSQDKEDFYSHPFMNELFHYRSEKMGGDHALMPEQLNTDKPQPNHLVVQHLQKVAEHFENYANKLLKVVAPLEKRSTNENDNQNKQKCPFMRVANAVGFKYGGTEKGNDSDDTGRRGAC